MSDAESERPAEQKSWVGPVIKVMGILLILSGLPFFFAVVPTLKEIREGLAWTEAPILALLIIILIGMPMAIAAGVGLLRRAEWSHGLGRLVALVPTLAGLANMVTEPSWELAIATVVVSIPGLFLFIALSVRDIRIALGADVEQSFAASLKTVFRYVVLLMLGMVVIGLTLSELPEIVRDLRMSRWQSQCEESGDIEPCGMSAQALIRWSESNEDWRAGFDEIKRLCDRGDSFSCRRFAYLHWYTDTSHLKASASKIVQNVEDVAYKKCFEGDGRACFILKNRLEKAVPFLDRRKEALAKSVELCREGDVWACRAVYQFSIVEHVTIEAVKTEDDRFAVDKLCDDGFAVGCASLDLTDEKNHARLKSFCEARPATRVCSRLAYELGEAGNEIHRSYCLEGGLGSCDEAIAAVPEDAPHRDLIAATYEAMAAAGHHESKSIHMDFGFWAVEPIEFEASQIESACDEGVAEACFALGVHLSRDRRGELKPELGKLADYDRSFMQACRLGMNVGCFAYAERIMNRPMGERRRIEQANQAFEMACERGNELACWYIDIDDELVQGFPEDYEALLIRGCRAQDTIEAKRGACRELAYFWAHEMGATPWTFSERRARALVREHCEESNGKWSCAGLIWSRRWGTGPAITSVSPPWHVEHFTAGEKSCKRRNLWACSRMLSAASTYPAIEESTVEELKSGVCEALPDVEECGKQ